MPSRRHHRSSSRARSRSKVSEREVIYPLHGHTPTAEGKSFGGQMSLHKSPLSMTTKEADATANISVYRVIILIIALVAFAAAVVVKFVVRIVLTVIGAVVTTAAGIVMAFTAVVAKVAETVFEAVAREDIAEEKVTEAVTKAVVAGVVEGVATVAAAVECARTAVKETNIPNEAELVAELADIQDEYESLSDSITEATASEEEFELPDTNFVVELHGVKCLKDEQTMKHEGVALPEPVEADAEDRLNSFDTTRSESPSTSTDEDCSESESPNTDSDYDEFSIPADLEERLSQLCVDQDVADFLIHQNPEDYTDISIEGKNANTISEEKLEMIREEKELWSRYKISTTDLVDEERVHQFMNSQIKRFPMASLEGTCELLVEMAKNNNEIVASAVGPAHMMFSEEINRKLRDGVGLREARDHIEKTPQHTKYEMHFGPNEEERTTLAKRHPPMFGYRYKLSGEDNPRNAATSDESDDAEIYQPVESPSYVSHSLCRNDMALFHLDYMQAEHMHDRLQSDIGKIAKMVDVKRMNQLKKYVRPNPDEKIRIRVKGQRGVLVRHTLNVEKQRAKGEAYHLTFKLDDGKLVKGDSGSIVFEEKSDGKMRPLGMFTGTAYIRAYNKSYYQAVILSKALEDISASYNLSPPGLQLFNASGRDRTSSGQIRHRSTTQPPAAQSVPDGINDI